MSQKTRNSTLGNHRSDDSYEPSDTGMSDSSSPVENFKKKTQKNSYVYSDEVSDSRTDDDSRYSIHTAQTLEEFVRENELSAQKEISAAKEFSIENSTYMAVNTNFIPSDDEDFQSSPKFRNVPFPSFGNQKKILDDILKVQKQQKAQKKQKKLSLTKQRQEQTQKQITVIKPIVHVVREDSPMRESSNTQAKLIAIANGDSTENDEYASPAEIHVTSSPSASFVSMDDMDSSSHSSKGKTKMTSKLFTNVSNAVSNLFSTSKSKSPSPPASLAPSKRRASPTFEYNKRPDSVRIIERSPSSPRIAPLIAPVIDHQLSEENDKLRAQNAALQLQIEQLQATITDLSSTIEIQSYKMDAQTEQMNAMQHSLASLEQVIVKMSNTSNIAAENNSTPSAVDIEIAVDKTSPDTYMNTQEEIDTAIPVDMPVIKTSTQDSMDMDRELQSGKDSMHADGNENMKAALILKTKLADQTTPTQNNNNTKNTGKPTQETQKLSDDPRPWNTAAVARHKINTDAMDIENIPAGRPTTAPTKTNKNINTPKNTYATKVASSSPVNTRAKPSYAAIAEKLVANKPEANVNAAKSALAFFHQRRLPATSLAEQRLGIRRVYVNGIPRSSYKDLKSHLFSLRFMLSKIVNISFIAKNCVEFLVQADYHASFLAKCRTCQLQILDEVDPTKPLDPKFPTAKLEDVKALFAQRVANIISNTKQEIVKDFFIQYAAERQIPLPTPDTPTPMTQ